MKEKIIKLINDQLGELPEEIKNYKEACHRLGYAHTEHRNAISEIVQLALLLHRKEPQNRELLASLIESTYMNIYYYICLFNPGNKGLTARHAREKYSWQIKLIERSLSLSWSEIVKRLEA